MENRSSAIIRKSLVKVQGPVPTVGSSNRAISYFGIHEPFHLGNAMSCIDCMKERSWRKSFFKLQYAFFPLYNTAIFLYNTQFIVAVTILNFFSTFSMIFFLFSFSIFNFVYHVLESIFFSFTIHSVLRFSYVSPIRSHTDVRKFYLHLVPVLHHIASQIVPWIRLPHFFLDTVSVPRFLPIYSILFSK